jgi:hypothetical protein
MMSNPAVHVSTASAMIAGGHAIDPAIAIHAHTGAKARAAPR